MNKFLFLILCISFTSSFSQQIQTQIGANSEELNNSSYVCKTATSFYAIDMPYVRAVTDGFKLKKYSLLTLQQEYDRELKVSKKNKKDDVRYDNILSLKDQLILFISSFDNKTETDAIVAYFINADGPLNPESKELYAAKSTNDEHYATCRFSLSVDSSKLVMLYKDAGEKDKNVSFILKTYDDKLNLLLTKNIELPFPSTSCEISDELLDKNGNLYFLAEVEPTKLYPDGAMEIVHYNSSNGDMHRYPVTVKQKFILNSALQMNEKGNLIYAGIYAKEKPKSRMMVGTYAPMPIMEGTFYFLFDPVKAEIIKHDEKDFKKIYPDEKLAFFYLDHVVVLENGYTILLCQFEKSVTIQNGKIGEPKSSSSTYYGGNIIAVGFNEGQEEAWVKRIQKDQVLDEQKYTSYALITGKDKIFLLYNDNYANKDIPLTSAMDKTTKLKNTIPMLAVIEGNGTLNGQALFENSEPGKKWLQLNFNFSPAKNETILLNEGEVAKKIVIQKIKIN